MQKNRITLISFLTIVPNVVYAHGFSLELVIMLLMAVFLPTILSGIAFLAGKQKLRENRNAESYFKAANMFLIIQVIVIFIVGANFLA